MWANSSARHASSCGSAQRTRRERRVVRVRTHTRVARLSYENRGGYFETSDHIAMGGAPIDAPTSPALYKSIFRVLVFLKELASNMAIHGKIRSISEFKFYYYTLKYMIVLVLVLLKKYLQVQSFYSCTLKYTT